MNVSCTLHLFDIASIIKCTFGVVQTTLMQQSHIRVCFDYGFVYYENAV